MTYGTTESFLSHFGLDSVGDLPGVDELKAAGLLDSRVPPDFTVPEPHAGDELHDDEDPLEDEPSGDADAVNGAADAVQDAVAHAKTADATPELLVGDAEDAAPDDQHDEAATPVPAVAVLEGVDKKTASTLAAVASAIAVELDASREVEPQAVSGDADIASADEAVNGEDIDLEAGPDITDGA